jgi:adenylate cyclase class 2
MAQEIEMKFPVPDHSDIRTTLASLAAKEVGSVEQTDRYLDFPDKSLLASDSGLRVRRVAGKPDVLTFKGPRQEGTDAKIREELESVCSSGGSIDAILDAMGMVELVTVCKRRDAFALDGCDVLLDEIDELGCFVEVEGPTLDAVQSVCAKLQLPGTPIRASYAQLLSEKLNNWYP